MINAINASKSDSQTGQLSPGEKLIRFLQSVSGEATRFEIQPLTPDASTRVYFRLPWQGKSAVAAVYPEAFDPEVNPFLDVSRLFLEAGIPIPEIYEVDGLSGIIIQEDLGDNQLARLSPTLSEDQRAAYLEEAISIIADIQAATDLAYERDSIASRLAFDEAKLIWELDFFVEHYFRSLRREKLKRSEMAELKTELNDIAAELSGRPRVLCHRDYHSANLMIDRDNKIRIVDYQDARMGPTSYDLVSLLLDRRTTPPASGEIEAFCLSFLDKRVRRGLPVIDHDEFAQEFQLMSVQRCLKAVGTFSNQTANFNRGEAYARFINPMLRIVLNAAETLNRFPLLQSIIKTRVAEKLPITI